MTSGASAPSSRVDVVVIGGGHNGLTAAAYLAKAGRSVLVLEALDHLGGAAVSAPVFDGFGVRLSRYSYLVSLLPRRIVADLGLPVRLRRRRWSSYTPVPGHPNGLGLLVDREDAARTAASFAAVTGSDAAHRACPRSTAASAARPNVFGRPFSTRSRTPARCVGWSTTTPRGISSPVSRWGQGSGAGSPTTSWRGSCSRTA